MAYMWATGYCYGCRQLFNFNPDLVPSIRVNAQGQSDPNGSKEPVCRNCIERANPRRIANGLPPIDILSGAYDAQEAA